MFSVICGEKEPPQTVKSAKATKMMIGGIKAYVNQVISPHQHGFSTGRSCTYKYIPREYIVSLSFKQLTPITVICQRPSTKGRLSNGVLKQCTLTERRLFPIMVSGFAHMFALMQSSI